jgi:hypothetical protein
MAPKNTIVKRRTRSTKTDTRWVFFEPPPPPPALVAPPPPPVVIPQGVQPILPHRQMASERP